MGTPQLPLFFYFFRGHTCGIWTFPGWGVKLELQLMDYATATATPDPSHVCNLHCRSWQRQILNPLSGARDWTCIHKDSGYVRYHWATTGTPSFLFIWNKITGIFSEQSFSLPSEILTVLLQFFRWKWWQKVILHKILFSKVAYVWIFLVCYQFSKSSTIWFCFFFVFLPFLGPLPWHTEVPRLGVKSEL